ncbi:thermonuclease family protein [Mesorhizobium sp. J428]|uniref:thermonuclease family protein n=1 Tax=Mesorhizobium sp. J428 TaxID=2898440 RepID=UPI0021516D14|nr:thermonuclease family protein [Mesorhizobium sp. J428]MCR5858335.1 thermonuclease family protein [Mesorhizobium sp. J428]
MPVPEVPPEPAKTDRAPAPPPAPSVTAQAEPVPASPPPPPAAPSPRAVGPSIIAVPPVDPGTLERVDPRPPLSVIAPAAPPKKPPPKPLLFQPVAEAAGVIAAGGRTIIISDVDVVGDGEACARPEGGEWPCGRAARTAFRSFLRSRAVTCDFPEGEVPDRLSTTCRVGPRDIGEWLVENGWARASGDKYAGKAMAARDAGRGIYGKGPAALPPELSSPVDLPASGTAQEPAEAGDISILPPETGASQSDGTSEGQPPAAPEATGPGEASPGLSPLPPPSSPLR